MQFKRFTLATALVATLFTMPLLPLAARAQDAPRSAAEAVAEQGGDLSLYGVALKGASVKEFVRAARDAGAKPLRASGSAAFDTKAAGVPALRSFSLVAEGDSLVAVQFDVEGASRAEETLRKMLVKKYGRPKQDVGGKVPRRDNDFDGEYARDGVRFWDFNDGMRLVWKKEFIGTTTLTYVDRPKFEALFEAALQAKGKDADAKAKTMKDKF